MKIISVIGAPHSGKSTLAAQIFTELKLKHFNCELVTEVARELVYQDKFSILENNQLLVSGLQFEKFRELKGKINIIITDTSLIFGAIYDTETPHLEDVLLYFYNKFDTINLFLTRPKNITFRTEGRVEKSWEEVEIIEQSILVFLDKYKIPYIEIDNNNRLRHAMKIIEREIKI